MAAGIPRVEVIREVGDCVSTSKMVGTLSGGLWQLHNQF